MGRTPSQRTIAEMNANYFDGMRRQNERVKADWRINARKVEWRKEHAERLAQLEAAEREN